MTNPFIVISEENDDNFVPTTREKFLKKAAKKLNEIERLEEKAKYHSLTREECDKLNQKDFWWACLYNKNPEKPSENKNKKKNKKEVERKRKEAEIKRREERKEDERIKEEKRREEERKRKILEILLAKKTNKKVNIEEEYLDLLLLHDGNNNKTFRVLSLKYHPDKNVGNLEWANEMQKKLGVCKEKYEINDKKHKRL